MIPKSELLLNNIQLSRIALGTHTFCDETEKVYGNILDEYVSNGGNIIDTARCYGEDVINPLHEPKSERCIGSWLKSSGLRNNVVLITKGGNPKFYNGKLVRHRVTAQDTEIDINKSLEELKTDYIDIYFLHKDNPDIEPAEAIEILSKYVKNGIVKHIGASNWSFQRIKEANLHAEKYGLPKFEYSELCFSLKNGITSSWKEQLPWEMTAVDYKYYQNNNIPVFGFGTQAYGFFYNDLNSKNISVKNKEIFNILKEISLKNKINMHQALLGFYFGCDIKNIPIISAKSISRLREVIENCNVVLDSIDVKNLLKTKFE